MKQSQTEFVSARRLLDIGKKADYTPLRQLILDGQLKIGKLIANGNADLVKETLDFRVGPKVVGTIKGQGDVKQRSGIMVPVLVTGNFSSPKFCPDLESIAKQQLQEKVILT